jgi:D-3-phosphoglycerate dehydrogenase
MMKIAVITPVKHLSGIEDLLSTKGEIFYLEEGTKSEVRDLLLKENIDAILCNPNQQTYKIDQELLDNTIVSLINTCSTGMNHIDQEYCKLNRIKIYSLTQDYELINNLPSTSELAFGLLLDLMRNITISNNEVKQNKTWDYLPFVGQQMKDFKIGIVGYGRLGKMMAKYCKAFDAEVYIYDPYSEESNVKELEDLFQICDAVSLHVHVTNETKYMINYNLLSYNVKFLINTSRGEIVNELDVIKALKENKLYGYGADVIEDEFGNIKNSPFFSLENSKLNYIFTPHMGGMTIQGQTKAYKWAINKF